MVFAYKGFAMWLIGGMVDIAVCAVLGASLWWFAAVAIPSFCYLLARALLASFWVGDREVVVRNGLWTHVVPTSAIVGSSVRRVHQLPPRLALKVETDGRVTVLAIDASARFTREGRKQLAASLGCQEIIPASVLESFAEFIW